MRCKQGDLAYIVVPSAFDQLLAGRVVEVGVDGECDNGTIPHPEFACWMCRFTAPWMNGRGNLVYQCWLCDDWLRPIHGGLEINESVIKDLREPA